MSQRKGRNKNSIDWEDVIKWAILIPLLAFAKSRTLGIIVLIIFLIIAAIAFKIHFSKKNKLLRKSLNEIDQMNGYEFEKYMKEMYAFLGYSVKHTPYVGDQGADLILKSKDGEKTAVQVKCYSGNVPNKAVQEVVASMKLYGCTKGAVVTNSYFTNPAIDLAKANYIELIDRKELSEMIKKVLTILESRDKQIKKEEKLSDMKIFVTALPPGIHGKNLRLSIGKQLWEKISHKIKDDANWMCKNCKTDFSNKPSNLQAHEMWKLDYNAKTAELTDIISLCSNCHSFYHQGLYGIKRSNGEITDEENNIIRNHWEKYPQNGYEIIISEQNKNQANEIFNSNGWSVKPLDDIIRKHIE